MPHPRYEPLFTPAPLSSNTFDELSSHATSHKNKPHPPSSIRFILTRTKYYAKLNNDYRFIKSWLPGPYLHKPHNQPPIKLIRTLDEVPEDIQSLLSPYVSYPSSLSHGQITTDPDTNEPIPSERLARPNHQALNNLLMSFINHKSVVGKTYSDHALFLSLVTTLQNKKGVFIFHLACSRPDEIHPYISANTLQAYLSRATTYFTFPKDPRPHPTPTLPPTIASFLQSHAILQREHLHLLSKPLSTQTQDL